jgi:hypothetical protein
MDLRPNKLPLRPAMSSAPFCDKNVSEPGWLGVWLLGPYNLYPAPAILFEVASESCADPRRIQSKQSGALHLK